MTSEMQKIAPLLCCGLACVALVAAGFVLFDSRDGLSAADDVGAVEFVSYAAEADEVDESPSLEDDADTEREWEDVDFQELADDGEWEILEPRAADDGEDAGEESDVDEERAAGDDADTSATGGTGQAHGQTGRLIVITNFTRARVTVNGDSYPAYSDDGENRGIELPANQVHEVFVEFDDNERFYEVTLDPGEERLLMVELTGMGDSPPRTERPERRSRSDERRRSRPQDRDDDDDDIADDEGRITVYSRPRGDIYVGDRNTGEQTPSTVDVDPGRHEVQVEYEGGEMSETKTVRVREGSRVKLFFRQDD